MPMPSAPTRCPLADDDDHDGYGQAGHLEQIFGDGFRLTAFFRFESGVCAGGVEQRDYRPVEFGGEPHEPQRLAVSFRVRHPEAPVLPAFHVAPFLVSQNHDGAVDASVFGAAKLRKPSHDCGSSPYKRSPCSSTKSSVMASM